jgi:hypothetical protein
MKTRREASILPWWAFQRVRLRAISGRSCSAGRIVFFEAQPLGVNKSPHRPHVCPDPARGQLPRQLAQGEWPRTNALAQPVGIGARQNRLLVASDLARRKASGLSPQILPLRHTGRTDLKRHRNRTNRLTGVSPRQRPFANVFRIRSRHPCWPPFPSMEFESEIPLIGNPDSGKKQRALASLQDYNRNLQHARAKIVDAAAPRRARPHPFIGYSPLTVRSS